MTIIQNQTFDQERALYESRGVSALDCRFDGPADGESAFKESRDISAERCYFNLRYPFWHDTNVQIRNCEMTPLCRAALWYSENISIANSKLHGIKALRECQNVQISDCDIISAEFGWFSSHLTVENSRAEGEYLFLYTGRNDMPRVSTHYTTDHYLITVSYDESNLVANITIQSMCETGNYSLP
jgi:hypothetical protein